MAFNLGNALKSSLNSSIVSSVSNRIGASVPGIGNNLINTALSGGSVKGALLGAVTGGLPGGSADVLGGIQSKLGGLAGGSGALGSLLGGAQGRLDDILVNSQELTGLINNPLKLVERGVADLAGLTGAEYGPTLDQYRELSQRSEFTEFADRGNRLPYAGDDTSASRIPNPLRDHNGFNYSVTLGVLSSSEYNSPDSYRTAGGFKNYIIQSSGGNLGKRYQVFDETAGNVAGNHHQDGSQTHAEYYIDNLELEAVIAPNPNTRVTLGTAISFTVTEPYSMGNFIQAIIGAAAAAGHSSYSDAPFCLRIDFNGWNLDGTTDANFVQKPVFVPIKFVNMDFNVSGAGSKYEVKAIPMGETGLADDINKISTQVRTNGTIVHQVLETNDSSLTSAINGQIEGLEEAGALTKFDRYVICFPKDPNSLADAFQARGIDESAFTTSPEEQEAQRTGFNLAETNPLLRGAFNPSIVTIQQSTETYAIIKSFAENTNLMNEIGLSPLNEDTNAPGNSSEAEAAAVVNPATGLVDTASIAAQPATVSRDHQFSQGEQITQIIEKIVMQSLYAAENATEGASATGLNKWFRIDTQVFMDESPATEQQIGRKPKVYVYSVVPYEVDEAVTMAPGAAPANTQGLRDSAIKEYNYIYSGKNEDVLNFDINFNNAFLLTANADFGNSSAPTNADSGTAAVTQQNGTNGVAPRESNDPTGPNQRSEPTPSISRNNRPAVSSGTFSNDDRRRIAENFHDRITNMNVDMVTAEMEIMGDPFFLPQQTGNHATLNSGRPGLSQDGNMEYVNGPVICIVNFKTPFDYQISGATMEMPVVVPGFSGLFMVWAVTNNFSRGSFTQTLKLIRRRGQDDEATTGNNNLLQPNSAVSIPITTVQSDGTVGQSGQPSTDCMPAPTRDDIRNLMPAIGTDVAAQLAAPFSQAEQQLAGVGSQFSQAVGGIDFGVANVPDLSKIISGIGSNPLDAFGGVGAAIGGANPLDAFGGVGAAVNSAASRASSAVNTAANQGVSAATDAATARVRNLLG